jgi:hypothetical protein
LLLLYKRLNVFPGDVGKIMVIKHGKKKPYSSSAAYQRATLAVPPELMLYVTDSMFLAGESLGGYHLQDTIKCLTTLSFLADPYSLNRDVRRK